MLDNVGAMQFRGDLLAISDARRGARMCARHTFAQAHHPATRARVPVRARWVIRARSGRVKHGARSDRMSGAPDFERIGADGVREFYCASCRSYRSCFHAAFVARGTRQCKLCGNRQRAAQRKRNRAGAIAANLVARFGESALSRAQVAALLRVSQQRSAWTSARGTAGLDALGIDRLDASRPLSLENSIVLETRQIRSRARLAALNLPDPLPAHVCDLATRLASVASVLLDVGCE
jgi:hypothetical protein